VSLLLARHGQTDFNRSPVTVQGHIDVPLNSLGLRQAETLAKELAQYNPTKLYSSPLLRARQTTEIVARELNLTPVYDPRLSESRRGEWEGKTFDEVKEYDPEQYKAWQAAEESFRFPGGESLLEQMQRVVKSLEEIAATGTGSKAVICHGGSIRVALCHYSQRGIQSFHRWQISNGSVVRVP